MVHIALAFVLLSVYTQLPTTECEEKKKNGVCIHLAKLRTSEPLKQVQKEQDVHKAKIAKVIPKKKKPEEDKPHKTIKKIIVKKEKVVVLKETVAQTPELVQSPESSVQKSILKETKNMSVHTQDHTVTKEVTSEKTELSKVSAEEQYVEENLAEIVALLQENLYYPRRARKRGIQGEVLIRFTLSKNAKISDVKIISSKSEVLSRGAMKTIENIEGKLPKPQEILTFNVPISYLLH